MIYLALDGTGRYFFHHLGLSAKRGLQASSCTKQLAHWRHCKGFKRKARHRRRVFCGGRGEAQAYYCRWGEQQGELLVPLVSPAPEPAALAPSRRTVSRALASWDRSLRRELREAYALRVEVVVVERRARVATALGEPGSTVVLA